MKTTRTRWAVKAAGTAALAMILATPSFAQSRDSRRGNDSDRGRTQTRRTDDRRGSSSNGSYRENQRVTAEGRVGAFQPERDGYRVQLEGRRDAYWVPRSQFGRGHDLRVGLSVRLGGIFRGSTIYVDSVNWPGDRGYDNYGRDFVSGVVERIDFRSETIWLREGRSRNLIAVEMNDTGRGSRDLRGLHRGDYVELSGRWLRGGGFEATRIEDARNGRY